MSRKISNFLLVWLVVSFCGMTAFGQAEETKAQLYMVWDVSAYPSKFMEYEAAAKEMRDLYAEHQFPYRWDVYRTEDFHYYYLIPVKDFAEVDDVLKHFGQIEQAAGEDHKVMVKKFGGTYKCEDFGMLFLKYDLSYSPEKPRVKAEEMNFIWWNYYYIKPGHEKEAEEIAKKWQALHSSNKIPDGYNLFASYMAPKIPFFTVAGRAKSASDYYTHSEKNIKKMGEEYQALVKETMDVCRKFEQRTGVYLRELSYTPKKK